MQDQLSNPLQSCSVEVIPETFSLVKIDLDNWKRIIERNELSPRGASPYMLFVAADGVTLILDDEDFGNIRGELSGARAIRNLRIVRFFDRQQNGVPGALSELIKILNDRNIKPLVFSGVDEERLLIDQGLIADTLKILGPHVAELC